MSGDQTETGQFLQIISKIDNRCLQTIKMLENVKSVNIAWSSSIVPIGETNLF